MDILLSPKNFAVTNFVKRLPETHYHVDQVAAQRSLLGGFFNVIHLHYHIKSDFYGPTEPTLQSMLNDRDYLSFDEMRRAAYLAPSAIIISKLQAYMDSRFTGHLDDIPSIIRLQGRKLDRVRIDVAAAQLGLLGLWRSM